MPHHPLTKFEIRRYYENEPKFIGIFSGDNLPEKINDGAYVINLDELLYSGLLYFVKKMKLFILMALKLNIFLKILKNLSRIKI